MNNICIDIKINFPENLEEKMDLTDWVTLARYIKKILNDEGTLRNIEDEAKRYAKQLQEEKERAAIRAQLATPNDEIPINPDKKAIDEKAFEMAEKVLSGECSQREAEEQSGISRFKIAKAMNKIIAANGGENPFKQHED